MRSNLLRNRFQTAGHELILILLALPITALSIQRSFAQGTPVAVNQPACAQGDVGAWQAQVDAFTHAGMNPATQENASGVTASW